MAGLSSEGGFQRVFYAQGCLCGIKVGAPVCPLQMEGCNRHRRIVAKGNEGRKSSIDNQCLELGLTVFIQSVRTDDQAGDTIDFCPERL